MAGGDAQEGVLIEELGEGEFKGEQAKQTEQTEQLSALRASKEKAKDLSYYYAQEESSQGFPTDAVVRQEDPLLRADGLGPKKLEASAEIRLADELVKWIETFSFADDGPVVKLYVEFPECIKDADIQCDFGRFSVDMRLRQPSGGPTYGLRIRELDGWVLEHERKSGFAHEIVPEKCKYRVSSNGQKVTVTLAKKDEKEKWYELKKKDLRSSFK